MSDEEVFAIKERAADVLMRLPGVTGVGIGGRERGGTPTGELVLKVLVEHKRPLAELTPGEILPAQFEGIGIDVSVLGHGEPETAPVAAQPPPPPPPAPWWVLPGAPLTADTDATSYPALIGGCRIQSDVPGVGHGTLGCILVHRTDPKKVYALTNYHVISGNDRTAPKPVPGKTRVGHPDGSSSCSDCSSYQFGTYVAGDLQTVGDAALVLIDAGKTYQKEIIGLDVVKGTATVPSDPSPIPCGAHTITTGEAVTQRYDVRKRGAKTRLTGGVVECIKTTHEFKSGWTSNNVTVVKPNPNAKVPLKDSLWMTDEGDSGSVLVNNKGEVVSLHCTGHFVSQGVPQRMNKSLSLPIEDLLQKFAAVGFPVNVAIGGTRGAVYTVPGATTVALPQELVPALVGAPAGQVVRVPVEAPWLPGVPRPTPQLLAGLEEELGSTRAGRRLITLWSRNGAELRALLRNHRRVALVWHRCGGPALLQMFIRMTGDPTLALPPTINGRPLTEALHRIADAFAPYATPGLRDDLAQARAALPELAGLTYPQVLRAFGPE